MFLSDGRESSSSYSRESTGRASMLVVTQTDGCIIPARNCFHAFFNICNSIIVFAYNNLTTIIRDLICAYYVKQVVISVASEVFETAAM